MCTRAAGQSRLQYGRSDLLADSEIIQPQHQFAAHVQDRSIRCGARAGHRHQRDIDSAGGCMAQQSPAGLVVTHARDQPHAASQPRQVLRHIPGNPPEILAEFRVIRRSGYQGNEQSAAPVECGASDTRDHCPPRDSSIKILRGLAAARTTSTLPFSIRAISWFCAAIHAAGGVVPSLM